MISPTSPAIAILASTVLTASAGHITVMGDSLTKEYALTFPGLPGIAAGIDATNPQARNWTEILLARRSAHFDLGTYRSSIFSPWTDMRLLGHEYHWAVPAVPARTFRNLLFDPDGAEILTDAQFKLFRDYAPDWKLTGARMAAQIAGTTDAVVIWFGANDLRFGNTDPAAMSGLIPVNYQTIYEGDGTGAGDPGPLMGSIRANIMEIAQFVRAANASVPIAICAVPHVGCAPEVKAKWPQDPQRTGRLTAALDALNADLEYWTENTLGGAWVDVYTQTKTLLDDTLDIGGVTFINNQDTLTSSDPVTAHNRFIFSHDGFHPTTTMQARVAQQIQQALRTKFPESFAASPPLGDREVLVNVLGIPASTGYDEFTAASGVPPGQRGPLMDPDGDGLPNIIEFSLAGNDPMGRMPPALPVPGFDAGAASITLTWMPRYHSNVYAEITCEQSHNPDSWTEVPAALLTANADGSISARVSGPAPVFLRLKVKVTP